MSDGRFRLAGALAIAALVLVSGAPSLRNGFLNYDDPQVIVENPRLADPGMKDAVAVFAETREYAYLPLYFLALMPDAVFFGGDPAGFHLGSLVWHAIASVLVLMFVHALTRSRTIAFVAGAIFAVHPIVAESVAWASGRKDQVSFVLLLLALSAALGHLRHGGAGRVVLSLACGALALLAKGSAVVYPLLVFLMVLFVRADSSLSSRARPTALLACATVVGAAGVALHLWIARSEGTTSVGFTTVAERILIFLESFQSYFRHLVFPVGLSIHYDVSPEHAGRQIAGGGLLVLCALAVWALWRRPRAPVRMLMLSAAWFLLAVLPFNGVFPQTSVAMADRYVFNALPAFGMAIGALVASIGVWPRIIATVGILALLVPLARSRYVEFFDGESVFRSAIRVDPADSLVALKLGEALRDKQPATANRAEAIDLFKTAVTSARDPVREARARLLLADTLLKAGRFAEAVSESDRLLELEREHGAVLGSLGYDRATVRFNRVAALLGDGQRAKAVSDLAGIFSVDPSHVQARLLRAGLDAQQALGVLAAPTDDVTRDRARQDVNRSIVTYENVIGELAAKNGAADAPDPEIQATSDLSRLLQRADWRPDRLNLALMHAEALIRRHPARAEGFVVRAQIMSDVDPAAALADLRAAAERDPASAVLLRSIASGFLALGKNRDAVAVLERARARDPGDPGPAAELRAIYLAAARGHLEGQDGPDLKLARGALKLAAAISPDHPEVLDLEAECFVHEKRHDEAAEVWRRLLAIEPDHAKAKLALARAHQQNALAILANMRALTESYPTDRRVARREELLAKVAADFSAAAELAPDAEDVDLARAWLRTEKRRTTVDPMLARARAAAEKGDLDQAMRLAEDASLLDAKCVEAAELLGHLAMQKSDEPRALTAFERTIVLDPDNLAANDALARLHFKRGERDQALTRARKFLALAATMRDETMMLRQEVEFMQQLVMTLEKNAPESR